MAWSDAVGWNKRRGWNNPAAGGGGSFATWDPADFQVADTFGNARWDLTGGNDTATTKNNSGGNCAITATRSLSGKCRFEVTPNATTCNPGLSLAALKSSGGGGGLFGGNGGLIWASNGHIFIGFSDLGVLAPTYVAGDHLGIEVDMAVKQAWFVVNGGSRLPAGTGVDISGMAGLLYPAADGGTTVGNVAVLNAGPTFNTTVTAGFGTIP